MARRQTSSSTQAFEALETRLCFSNIAPVVTPGDLVASPLSSTAVKLTWVDQSTNEERLIISRSTTQSGVFEDVIRATRNTTAWVDNNLQPGTQYFYRIRAQAAIGDSANSLTANTTTLTVEEDLFAKVDEETAQLNVRGTSGNDVLRIETDSGGDIVVELNGDSATFLFSDVDQISILTYTGNDRVSVGPGIGSVYISGGSGNDTLGGGEGNDRIDGGSGRDSLKGNDGDDTISGGVGNDIIYGLAGADQIRGGKDKDRIFGGEGDDRLYGDLGIDKLFGEEGSDQLFGSAKDLLEQD